MSIVKVVFWLRLATLIGLCLPALDLAWRWYSDDLGARPVTEATHITGDWAVVFLLCSLALTPARSVYDWMPLVQIRRRIGVAAALYAGLHFLIYVADQKWNLVVVALEIVKRFYLTIGFAALLVLTALAITSTNGWQRRLRRNWKRLHWLVYPGAVLAILHFFIQSKANVGEATVAAGLFAWLMIWRWMPAKLRTRWFGLLLLAVGATLAALVFEVAWYGLVNHVDPLRVLRADIDPDLAPRPTLKVLLAGLGVVVLAGLRRLPAGWRRLQAAGAMALALGAGWAAAPARDAAAQDARDKPAIRQTVQLYDANLSFPAPLWVETEHDAVEGSEVFREQTGKSFVLEQIRKGETFADWTEMLKVTAVQSPEVRKIDMEAAMNHSSAAYLEACGSDNVGRHVFREGPVDAVFGIFCGNTPHGPAAIGYGDGVGEISVNRVFLVKDTLILVQYAWRRGKFGPSSQGTFPVPTPVIMQAVERLESAQAD